MNAATIASSNVFEGVGGTVSFRDDVNTNAYYFVDVCAERGPAPIYFIADRDSRIGSPVVVAQGGETNRVPLLIGAEYAVTSTVPISVEFCDDGFTQVTQNDERSYVVKWPLAFHFAEGTPGLYTVSAVPFDPGVAYDWASTPDYDEPGGRIPLMSSPLPSECRCWSGNGATVQVSLKKVGCLAGLLVLVLLVVVFLVLFTDVGRYGHAAHVRKLPDPLDVAEFQRLSPSRHVVTLDSIRRAELLAVCKKVAIAYSNEQVDVLCEWRRKLPAMLEPLNEDDLGYVWSPIIEVAKDELHEKLNRILGNKPIGEDYVNVVDFKRHVDALTAFSLLYGDIMLRRKDFGVPFKILEASVFCRLKSYRDGFRAEGRNDLEKSADYALARWIGQIESKNSYMKALLVKDIAWLRVQGDKIMENSGKSWEEVSQDQVRGTIHTLTWTGYTPKWLDEFKVIPRHATSRDVSPKK